jgi:hypothetical protein
LLSLIKVKSKSSEFEKFEASDEILVVLDKKLKSSKSARKALKTFK